MKNRQSAFTLTEILIIVVISSFVLTGVYRMLSHGFSYFLKGQTKLTNLRIASLIIEQIKYDVRSAVFCSKEAENKFELIDSSNCKFPVEDKVNKIEKMVEYKFDSANGTVTRKIDGEERILNSNIKIIGLEFKVEDETAEKSKPFVIDITVDKDKGLETRSDENKKNIIELRTVLYPKFFEENMTEDEKFWRNARNRNID